MMKISLLVTFLVSFCFGCSPVSDGPDLGDISDLREVSDVSDLDFTDLWGPKNCDQYSADKNACVDAKCDFYRESPEVWCIRDGKCLNDKDNKIAFCQYLPREDFGGISSGYFQSETGIAVEFSFPPQGPGWEACPENGGGAPICQCYAISQGAAEGECF